ncbi:MAG: DUF4065 domain-containing protein, partial [Lachnospiraceae bacterium]|nr:DUF4065 domain-containing protein [Lachnospiraceae bacterium]
MERIIIMANIFEAANFLLEHRAKTTAWQLQKLCYYSKAWGLSICGEPIFDESFEAWANGPVCRRLYFRHRGKKYIPQNLFASYSSENVSEYGRAIMLAVLRKYGDLTGEELRELSHRELPWKKTREGIPDGENCEKMIPDNLIVEFYSGQASDFMEIENE